MPTELTSRKGGVDSIRPNRDTSRVEEPSLLFTRRRLEGYLIYGEGIPCYSIAIGIRCLQDKSGERKLKASGWHFFINNSNRRLTGEMADKGRENDLPQTSKNVLKVSSFRTVAAMMSSFIE